MDLLNRINDIGKFKKKFYDNDRTLKVLSKCTKLALLAYISIPMWTTYSEQNRHDTEKLNLALVCN